MISRSGWRAGGHHLAGLGLTKQGQPDAALVEQRAALAALADAAKRSPGNVDIRVLTTRVKRVLAGFVRAKDRAEAERL